MIINKLTTKFMFTLPELSFKTDALEPFMDQQTVEIHHGKHHAGYMNKLNAAMEQLEITQVSLETEVFPHLDNFPAAVKINAGQYWNHNFFWDSVAPTGQQPGEMTMAAIEKSFADFDAFKSAFSDAAGKVFGSGWAWVCVDGDGKLHITTTENEENPLMTGLAVDGQRPIMVIDVWEHAYYLKYQNRRPEFIDAFFNIINWNKVEERING